MRADLDDAALRGAADAVHREQRSAGLFAEDLGLLVGGPTRADLLAGGRDVECGNKPATPRNQ